MKPSFLLSSKAGMAFMVVCLSVLTLATSCSKKFEPTPEPVGELDIKAVNAVIGSTDQDLLVNGVAKIKSLGYNEASDYVKMTSGASSIGFYDTGTTATMNAGGQVGLPIGAKVSVYYFKTGKGPVSAVLFDDATANPSTGKAKVRFLNLNDYLDKTVSGSISVTVQGASTSLISVLEFATVSNYFEVDAGSKFVLKTENSDETTVFDSNVIADKIYTIWIDGTSATNLTGHLVVQN